MFKNPFSTKGRIRRTEYAISSIILLIYYQIIYLIFFINDDYVDALLKLPINLNSSIIVLILNILLYLVGFIFSITQNTKRCHDVGESGWMQLVPFYLIFLLFKKGNLEENEYGQNPKLEKKY